MNDGAEFSCLERADVIEAEDDGFIFCELSEDIEEEFTMLDVFIFGWVFVDGEEAFNFGIGGVGVEEAF